MNSYLMIKNIYETLKGTDKKIAGYILSDPERFAHGSVRDVALQSGVSTAAVTRFSQSLGFKGFSSLKLSLVRQSIQEPNSYEEMLNQETSTGKLNQWLLDSMKRSLDDTFSLLNEEALEAIADKLNNAGKIFLAGLSISNLVVQDFEQKLTRVGFNCYSSSDPHMLMTALAHIEKDDVLFVVSHSGETALVNKMALYVDQLGGTVISITGAQKNTLSSLSAYQLIIPVKESEHRLGAINSRLSCLAVLDAIYFSLTKMNKEKSSSDIIKTRQAISFLNNE